MSYRMIYTLRRLMCDKFSVLCTMAELNAKQEREDKVKINVYCAVCGKCEQKCPSDAKRYKTCSIECRGKYSATLYDKKISKTCEVCGKQYKIKQSHEDIRRTCSTECKYKLKGGRYVTEDGYVMIFSPDNQMANGAGYVCEHRLVMSEILGRPLIKGEEVHHIDGNKSNNDPENLQLMTKAEHSAHHARQRSYIRDASGRIKGIDREDEFQ